MQTSIKLGALALPLLLTLPPTLHATALPGVILILDKDNAQCSFAVPEEGTGMRVQYEFSIGSGCKGIEPRKIKFDGLPSATRILITDDNHCSKLKSAAHNGEARNFWMELRTTKRNASSDWYELEDLASYNDDEIIAPGLQMRSKYIKQSSLVRDRASCIRVITSTTAPPDFESASWRSTHVYSNISQLASFECGANEIVVGRKQDGTGLTGRTTYTCATAKKGSTDLTVVNANWSDWLIESDGMYFTCPSNTVMVGRAYQGSSDKTRYKCGELKNGNLTKSIHWSDQWSEKQDEDSSDFHCPTGAFMVGRFHEGDDNGSTSYRCATAYNQGAEKP